MENKKTYSEIYQKLHSASNESEVLEYLKEMLKHFSNEQIGSDILDNPYFKALLPEVIETVFGEIDLIKKNINKEIDEIEHKIDSISNMGDHDKQVRRLKELKRECILLLFEIDQKKKDLNSLI